MQGNGLCPQKQPSIVSRRGSGGTFPSPIVSRLGKHDRPRTLEDTLTDRKHPAETSSNQQVKKLLNIVQDVEKASRALPEEERQAYRTAQQSVVDARRRAELQEGLLQVN